MFTCRKERGKQKSWGEYDIQSMLNDSPILIALENRVTRMPFADAPSAIAKEETISDADSDSEIQVTYYHTHRPFTNSHSSDSVAPIHR